MAQSTSRVEKHGTIVIPAALSRCFGIEGVIREPLAEPVEASAEAQARTSPET